MEKHNFRSVIATASWRAPLLIPGLLALMGVTALPSSAAVPDRQIVSASSASSSDDKGMTVTCPDGLQRLASGADVAGGGSEHVIIDDMIPGPRNVTAYGYEDYHGTTATWSIRVWAVCGRLSSTVHTYASSSAYDTRDDKVVTASCASPMVVLGTGFALLGARGSAVVHQVAPTSTSVTVRAWEVDGGPDAGSWSATAYAICAPNPGGRSQTTTITSYNSGDKLGTAICPEGKEAFGAGFDLDGFRGRLNINYLIPTSVGTVLTSANELIDTTNDWALLTYAICANE